jgi:hypothetical protein
MLRLPSPAGLGDALAVASTTAPAAWPAADASTTTPAAHLASLYRASAGRPPRAKPPRAVRRVRSAVAASRRAYAF